MADPLPIPSAASDDPNALELIRVWTTGTNQVFAINALVLSDPANWGSVLVDLAVNVAGAFENNNDMSAEEAFVLIKKGFVAEWENPTQ
ncbi:MAG: DUF5076 domain-containing protein [Alphaproteobacteria bacterium]|nr:DUF5076 domain-containing protein [Alphaproteobacteria bacterium]